MREPRTRHTDVQGGRAAVLAERPWVVTRLLWASAPSCRHEGVRHAGMTTPASWWSDTAPGAGRGGTPAHLQADEDEGDARPVEVLHQLAEPQRHGGVHAADTAALQDGGPRGRRCGHRCGRGSAGGAVTGAGPGGRDRRDSQPYPPPPPPEHQPLEKEQVLRDQGQGGVPLAPGVC